METCGKDITDEEAKEAVKDAGIGTPATRAAIIATLFKRDYIERSGKSIRPTEKGLYLFEAVKDMQVADVEMTGCWEKALAQIEGHTLDTETFMRSIRDYTHKAIGEILRLEFPLPKSRSFTCPKCKCGHVIIRGKAAKCDKEGCGLMVFRRFLNKELTDQQYTVEVDSSSSWTHTWTDLPRYDENGERYNYTVDEETTQKLKDGSYRVSITKRPYQDGAEYTVLNVREPDAISAKVTKNWNDNSDNDGKRPHKLTFHVWGTSEQPKDPTDLNRGYEDKPSK